MCSSDLSEVEARQAVYNGGLQIYSCMDLDLQTGAERIFADNSNFAKFPGQSMLCVRIADSGATLRSDSDHSIMISDSLLTSLAERIGEDNIYVK